MSDSIDAATLVVTTAACAATVVATAVNYHLLRLSMDAEIVVYPEHDEKRPQIIMLVIKNVGRGAAYNARFYPERPIPARAWGIEKLSEAAQTFEEGPFVGGIPFMPAGASRIFDWGQYGGLREALGEELKLSIQYYSRTPFGNKRLITADSILDVSSFAATTASERHILKIESKELKDIATLLQSVVTGIGRAKVSVQLEEKRMTEPNQPPETPQSGSGHL